MRRLSNVSVIPSKLYQMMKDNAEGWVNSIPHFALGIP